MNGKSNENMYETSSGAHNQQYYPRREPREQMLQQSYLSAQQMPQPNNRAHEDNKYMRSIVSYSERDKFSHHKENRTAKTTENPLYNFKPNIQIHSPYTDMHHNLQPVQPPNIYTETSRSKPNILAPSKNMRAQDSRTHNDYYKTQAYAKQNSLFSQENIMKNQKTGAGACINDGNMPKSVLNNPISSMIYVSETQSQFNNSSQLKQSSQNTTNQGLSYNKINKLQEYPIAHLNQNKAKTTLRVNTGKQASVIRVSDPILSMDNFFAAKNWASNQSNNLLKYVEALAAVSKKDSIIKFEESRTELQRREWEAEGSGRFVALVKGPSPYPPALFFLAQYYGDGTLGFGPDKKAAYNNYLEACRYNHATSLYRVSLCHEMGIGCNLDQAKSVEFYKKAANADNPEAMYKLGIIVKKGLFGQPQDYAMSHFRLKRATDIVKDQDPYILHALGEIYEIGYKTNSKDELVKNADIAREYYIKAAKLNHPPSHNRLGNAFEFGTLGFPGDLGKSFKHYSIAAEFCHTDISTKVFLFLSPMIWYKSSK